ncbi:ribosome biogenesis GTP-binding protein YsxC [Helicocarpus griseus UAMH5409]|uniref:GTP-binding protein 8 n=1 Tax=Helicocarpus griseus UAMH5409 TaxID=1447875 RepID=A0A2B7WR20_9EURO|nr:ribosome biogenesis GTP-binding protein YsxC [Helicocarpus griseus UAMH5409]
MSARTAGSITAAHRQSERLSHVTQRLSPLLSERRLYRKAKPQAQLPLEHQSLRLSDIAFYYDTVQPNRAQLKAASALFKHSKYSPVRAWSASEFRTIPSTDMPEVAFLGRSNVGKSSLLNALMDHEICHTSQKPGRTREMNGYGVGGLRDGHSRLVLVDMPGYGSGSREEWGEEIMKYLTKRKQLRRTYVLLDTHHGMKASDAAMLSMLRESAIPHQIILSKVDSVLQKGGRRVRRGLTNEKLDNLAYLAEKIRAKVQPMRKPGEPSSGVPALGEILACSLRMPLGGGKGYLGINPIRWSILEAAGLTRGLGEEKKAPAGAGVRAGAAAGAAARGIREEGGKKE